MEISPIRITPTNPRTNTEPLPNPDPDTPTVGSFTVHFVVNEGIYGSSERCSINTQTPYTLRQLYEEYLALGKIEDAFILHDFFINDKPASADDILSADDEVTMLRVPRANEMIVYVNTVMDEELSECFAVVPSGTYNLDKFLLDYVVTGIFETYEEITAAFNVYLNDAPATAGDTVAANDIILLTNIGESSYFTIFFGLDLGDSYSEVEDLTVIFPEGVTLAQFYCDMVAPIFGITRDFDDFIWSVNDQIANADTPLHQGDKVFAKKNPNVI